MSTKKTEKQELAPAQKGRWTKKKIIAASVIGAAVVAFVVFLVVVLVMGLGPIRPIKSSEEEARVVGSCGDYQVKHEELRYITLLHRQSLDATLGEYSTLREEQKREYETALYDRVLADLENNYVILALCDQYGIDPEDRRVMNYVQEQLELLIDENFAGSKKEYKAWLAENNLTDSFLRLMYRVDRLEVLLLEHLTENKLGIEYDNDNKAEFVDYVMEGKDWVRTIHAFYPKESDTLDVSNSLVRAKETAARLAKIEDDQERLGEMRSAIGLAPFVPGYSTTGNGIYFTYGAMGEAYEKAGFALEIYGTGEVVETEEGYYVIMRMPLEREHLDISLTNDLLSQYQYAVLKGLEDVERETLTYEPVGQLDAASLLAIK